MHFPTRIAKPTTAIDTNNADATIYKARVLEIADTPPRAESVTQTVCQPSAEPATFVVSTGCR